MQRAFYYVFYSGYLGSTQLPENYRQIGVNVEPLIFLERSKRMINSLFLEIPDSRDVIRPGNIVRLGRFSNDDWTVCFGWYEFGGNRPVCGWYLTKDCGLVVKPLQLPDLDDIYLISY